VDAGISEHHASVGGLLLKLRVNSYKARIVTWQFKMGSCHSSVSGLDDNGPISETPESCVRSAIDTMLK